MAAYPLPEAQWIVAGDFNMTEASEDRSSDYHARSLGRREEAAWSRFTLKLGIHDVYYSDEFRKIGTKYHTWRRERPVPTWSRLDRFYVTSDIRSRGGRHGIWSTIYHLSDHAGIFLQIPLQQSRRPHRPRFNRSLTSLESAHERFTMAWTSAMKEPGEYSKATRIVTAFEHFRRVSESISKEQKRAFRDSYDLQFKEINEAESALGENWHDLDAWQKLNSAQESLEAIRQLKLERRQNSLSAHWCTVGDRCSKEFFEFHTARSRQSSINELVEDGKVHRSAQDIEDYIQRYYTALYSNDRRVEENTAARRECLACVPAKVTAEMNAELTAGFTCPELKRALQDVPANKAPGHDTIPLELLRELWGVVGTDLTEFLSECMEQGQLPESVKYGLTSLIPKGGEASNIRNFRPISVLTGLYKLTAKTLANRLQPILPACILPSQTAFVKNRCILDNVLLAYEAVHWSRESNQSTVILLLDFEKAYDRVNWQFLESAMEKLGFSAEWIKWTSALYRGASSSILANGKRLPKFPIQRSVRQGCPLAPYLYLIIADVLSYMINSPDYGVEGMQLPDESFVRIQCSQMIPHYF